MSLCESVLQLMQVQAEKEGFRQVKTVVLELGELAVVEPASLQLCFEVITRNTLADGARLVMMEVPGRAWCEQCHKEVAIRQRYDPCPECGGFGLQVCGGDEMRVKELEVV